VADLKRLDRLLASIVSADDGRREAAAREVLEVEPAMVSAIDHRMNRIADQADRAAMKKTLAETRRQARKQVRERMRAAGQRGKVKTPDYLEMLVARPRPASRAWRDVVSVVAMSRMLVQIATVESARELIDVYVRFGEFLRVDTQLQLERLGHRAVAALVEARRHQAEKIGRWAERQLDLLGMAIPSEAVQINDPDALGDVLRAYGRIQDPDAARIVIAFANSERAQVRLAARQSVALMGEVANWQLRDAYANFLGRKPRRDWSWKRTARELFGEFDRTRLARVYQLFEQGMAAQRQGDLEGMRRAFNQVLAHNPGFERRDALAAGYLAFARKAGNEQREVAIDALRRAERIGQDQAAAAQIKSLRLTLEGEALLAQGIADQVLFRRAAELDPSNTRARDALTLEARKQLERQTHFYRYAAAAVIGLVALLAIAYIGLWRPRRVVADRSRADDRAPPSPSSAPPDRTSADAAEPLDHREQERGGQ
jgi:hypothetical protein